MNQVRLFSNGTAVVNREYEVSKSLNISIPVKKADLDEVIASFQVFGDVAITIPPTYSPTNVNLTSLQIDLSNVIKSLATNLAGSRVALGVAGVVMKVTGKLIGIQEYTEIVNNSAVNHYKIVVNTDGDGIKSYPDSQVLSIDFTDEVIKSEIDKVLKQQYETIKPDSSIVDLTVTANKEKTPVVVSYATPCAAWKIRYQLRIAEDGNIFLEGQAIIDNDTDDDWKDTIISVITGDPITFSTDLAEIRRPSRSRVNVVSDEAIGAVQPAIRSIRSRKSGPRTMQAMACSMTNESQLEGTTVCDFGGSGASGFQPEAEVEESGDFSIFTSPNKVTIPSKKSSIIHLFNSKLSNAKNILYYKDGIRPYRTIRFKNETNFSLGKGVCEIFIQKDNVFQGKAILESCKSGEDSLLVYAKDNSVKIIKEVSPVESKTVSMRFQKGNGFYERSTQINTIYTITGNGDSVLEIDYPRNWTGSLISVPGFETIQTTTGIRIVAKNENVEIKVLETYVAESNVGQISSDWLAQNWISLIKPIADNPSVKEIMDLRNQIELLNTQIEELTNQAEEITSEQDRLKSLIPNGHPDQSNIWRTELATNESELRKLRRVDIPKLEKEVVKIQSEIDKLILSLTVSWSE